MADSQVRINIICDRNLKLNAKQIISEKGIEKFQEGYLKIFQLGLKEFKKKEKKKKESETK